MLSKAPIRAVLHLALLLSAMTLAACSSSSGPGNPTGDFELRSLQENLILVEGDTAGLSIPLSLTRVNGHETSVELSIEGVTPDDEAFVSSSFTRLALTPNNDNSLAILTLAVADLPILAQQRSFRITATDGAEQHVITIDVDVQPVDAPDVYLLAGQSNMVGFSGDGTKQAFVGGFDEPNARILQLNVTPNNQDSIFLDADDFTSISTIVADPLVTVAEDPLHIPFDNAFGGKTLDYIGLGLSFAKAALPNTSREIILVPAAWSGSAFCANDQGPPGQWNAQATTDPALGNTWLFDRAVARANLALQTTGGILRGILWHQGESDANNACAGSYAANLERLAQEFRTNIDADARGGDLRRNDSNIPFVVGTMSRGIDERDDLSTFSAAKQIIDDAHRNLPNTIASGAVSNHDDLVPANGFPCGNTTCVHFGAEALREMGRRYYDGLLRAAGQ